MTADLWTVFAACILPYVPYMIVATFKWQRGIYDANNPRASNDQLEGWSLRAKGAELNSWEALASYLAVTFIAYQTPADRTLLASLGVAWVASRLLYFTAYIAGKGGVRILMWSIGIALMLARFGLAVTAGS